MGRRVRAAGCVGAAVLSGLLTASRATSATLTTVAWSTYLRAGPGQTYAALSELEHDTRVQVLGCDAGWCRVSGASLRGYVDRDALALPRTLAPSPPSRRDCVVTGQADNRGPIATRFCSAAAAGG